MRKRLRRWGNEWAALSCACLTVVLLHSQTPTGSDTAAMESEFQSAMAAEDAGDLNRAESLLIGLRSSHPGIFAVDESLGLLYVTREKITEALPLLQAAVLEQPDSDLAHANLGAAYFQLHRNREALDELQHAAQLNGRNAVTQQALGQLWMETNQPARAAEAFGAALELLPDDANLQLNRAQALLSAGQSKQARQILANFRGAEQSAAAQSLLGDMDEKAGAYQQAAQHYSRAVELEPSESNVWMLGLEFLCHWTFDAAIREFEAAVPKFPDSARMRLGLGTAYFGDGTYDKAIPVFADLLDADPGNKMYAELLGQSCTAQMQEAPPRCSALMNYVRSHPSDAEISTYTATMFLQGAATEEHTHLARGLLESALQADPMLVDAQYEMGMLKQDQSDWGGSISNLEAAVSLKPNFAKAHYKLALAYWRVGRKKESQAEMELQNKLSQQNQDNLNQRLRQVTTFLIKMHD